MLIPGPDGFNILTISPSILVILLILPFINSAISHQFSAYHFTTRVYFRHFGFNISIAYRPSRVGRFTVLPIYHLLSRLTVSPFYHSYRFAALSVLTFYHSDRALPTFQFYHFTNFTILSRLLVLPFTIRADFGPNLSIYQCIAITPYQSISPVDNEGSLSSDPIATNQSTHL